MEFFRQEYWSGLPFPGLRSLKIRICWCHALAFVQLPSHVLLFVTPWTAARQDSLSFTISQSLLKLMSIESVIAIQLIRCCPLLLLPSIFPSIRVFSNELVLLIRWPKYWSFSFNISPSSEYSGLISFRIDLLDLLAVQGTLQSLLQHHSSKASILWHSAFFIENFIFLNYIPINNTWEYLFLHCLSKEKVNKFWVLTIL